MPLPTLAALLIAAAVALSDLPPDSAARPAEVIRTNDYSEGVVVDHAGNLYFSHEKVITKVAPDGKTEVWAETGAPNGHKILADGTHLVCDAGAHAVLHLDADGRRMAPASTASDGVPLRGPNDLTLDPRGGFYFTDPGGSDESHRIGTVHHVGPDGITHTVATGLAFPNGIVLRPGGETLLVGESKENRVLSFKVEAPGKLGPMAVFAKLPSRGEGQIDDEPDGIALDDAGNLFVAHYGMRQIQVVSPEGKVVRRYAAGNLTTSNVCFAGPGMDRLYTTGGTPGALFRLDLGVRGLTILPPKAP